MRRKKKRRCVCLPLRCSLLQPIAGSCSGRTEGNYRKILLPRGRRSFWEGKRGRKKSPFRILFFRLYLLKSWRTARQRDYPGVKAANTRSNCILGSSGGTSLEEQDSQFSHPHDVCAGMRGQHTQIKMRSAYRCVVLSFNQS